MTDFFLVLFSFFVDTFCWNIAHKPASHVLLFYTFLYLLRPHNTPRFFMEGVIFLFLCARYCHHISLLWILTLHFFFLVFFCKNLLCYVKISHARAQLGVALVLYILYGSMGSYFGFPLEGAFEKLSFFSIIFFLSIIKGLRGSRSL